MCFKLMLLLILLHLVNSELDNQYKVVETLNGAIRGIRNTTFFNGVPFYSFKGIPYGKAPINDLRFKAPIPSEPWKPDILNAFEYGSICPQLVIICNPTEENEDCLTLNIFVPADGKYGEKFAVLFFIHGGSFRLGSGDNFFYGPDFIMEKQTILVTINYRLGALGFMSLNSSDFSGNMGLKDQQLALKWIHSNIEHFGGDNQRITVFGQSAGGGAVNLHILSDESRKYFHNAILMSGSAGNVWALSKETNHLKLAYEIAANELNRTLKSFDELVEFFKTVPAFNLHQYLIQDKVDDFFEIVFAPVIETRDAKEPFLLDLPDKLYESSKIDIDTMFTVTSAEMLSLLPEKPHHFMDEVGSTFNIFAGLPFRGLNLSKESVEYRNLTDEIRQFYFGNGTFDESMLSKYYDFLNDINFIYGIDHSVKCLSTNSIGKTFYTWFAVDSVLNAWKKTDILFGHMFDEPGAGHGDDLCYLFRCAATQNIYEAIKRNKTDEHSKISLQTIENITKIFTNFAKYGEPSYQNDPVEAFLPVQENVTHFLTINNNGLTTGMNPHQKSIEFWNHIKQRALELSDDIRQNRIE